MRIHLSLDPKHLVQPVAGPSSGPLVNIGGDLVLVELQGELNHEGDKSDGVVGILGFDRPDKPTLHLGQHHLLHGKITNLAKPYAVIRRAVALVTAAGEGGVDGEVEGDAEEEEDIQEDVRTPFKAEGKSKGKGKAEEEEEEEEEPPLFPEFQTPKKKNEIHPSSSPSTVYPSSVGRGGGYGYSSELDFSSPPIPDSSPNANGGEEESEDEDEEERRRKRAKKNNSNKKERTRRYEVVGIVRKKVVFALRPEPIVTATILPE